MNFILFIITILACIKLLCRGFQKPLRKAAWRGMLAMGLLLSFVSCANPSSGPDGGPYDETPPRIVAMSPTLGGTNEKGKKVTITFDEAIKVENAQEKVTISPPQIDMPEIKTTGRRISVELQDSLKANTTYTIDFSDAIVDANEGNPLGNFTYYFSTGTQLDTMEVAGHVLAANNLEPIKGILVGLHANQADSAFTTLPFDRVARTDGSGHFVIKGVAPGAYRIYALKDVDNDFKLSQGEMLAFSSTIVKPDAFPDIRRDTLWRDTVNIDTIRTIPYTHFTPDDILLLAFTEKSTSRALLKTQREPEYFRAFFTAPSKHIPIVKALNFNDKDAFVVERSVGNDTLTYWLRDTALVNRDTLTIAYTYEATDDSTHLNVLRTDTLDLVPLFSYERRMKLQEAEKAKWEKERSRKLRRGETVSPTYPAKPLELTFLTRGSITPDNNIRFSLKEPARSVDTTKFHLFLKVDSTYHKAAFRLERDSLALLNYTLRAEWRPGQQYVINVDSAAIEGLSGKVNKPYDARMDIEAEESFGSLFLLLPDADSTSVVQLMEADDKVKKQVRVKNGRADFFYVKPADYYLRIFNDRNQNGSWNTGSYAQGIQPEEVYYYPSKITIRANWDIEQTWNVHERPLDKQKPRELVKQKEDKKKTPKNRNAERLRQKRGN